MSSIKMITAFLRILLCIFILLILSWSLVLGEETKTAYTRDGIYFISKARMDENIKFKYAKPGDYREVQVPLDTIVVGASEFFEDTSGRGQQSEPSRGTSPSIPPGSQGMQQSNAASKSTSSSGIAFIIIVLLIVVGVIYWNSTRKKKSQSQDAMVVSSPHGTPLEFVWSMIGRTKNIVIKQPKLGGTMFTYSNSKIEGWQDRIGTLEEDLKRAKERASRFFHYGQQHAGKIDGYFQSLLLENASHLKSSISIRPLASVAGWQYDLWEKWDPTTSKEDGYLRMGELVEERLGGQYDVPAFLPFIGEGKTIIFRCDESSKKSIESYMQSIIVRTALMLPHQARYTLLDPAGNGLAFPMRKQLAHVRESSDDVRRDLDIVVKDIQRIIANYLNQEIRSLEKVAPNIRANEKFQFVFAADFPNSYDRRVIEALQSIGNTGMPAGVYLFIQYNQSIEFPRDMSMDNFKNAFYVDAASLSKSISISGCNFRLRFDSVPEERLQSLLFSRLSETELLC